MLEFEVIHELMPNSELLELIKNYTYTPIDYYRKEMLKYFSNKLAEIDEEYKKFPVINSKYINFAMAKIMEMNIAERNQVALYLFNIVRNV